jgi:formamidopyrimidine-DNA glycosylase
MPELPELEIWSKNLNRLFRNKKILDIVFNENHLANISANELRNKLLDQNYKIAKRIGKFLQIEFTNNHTLLIDPGDKLTITTNTEKYSSDVSIGIKFELKNSIIINSQNAQIEYSKFSTNKSKLLKNKGEDITSFDFKKFEKIFSGKKKELLKSFLLDEKNFLGLGNEHLDEILFYAKQRPRKNLIDLTKQDLIKIYDGIFKIYSQSLENVKNQIGTTFNIPEVKWFRIVHKAGKSCPECGYIISKGKVNTLTTYYCRRCQKL